MKAKQTFLSLFAILSLILLVLPFLSAFFDFFTRIIMKFELYRSLQNLVVPYELKIVAFLLDFFGIEVQTARSYLSLSMGGKPDAIYLTWNCVGWQSAVLFLITLLTGLAGRFKLSSKFEAFVLGALGTYIVNIFRLVAVVAFYSVAGRPAGVIFHDYFSNIMIFLWLFFFWWFAYSFVLEESEPKAK